jgi:hypothetical protein
MKLWHNIFIMSFIVLYGSLSLVILGSWIHEAAEVLRDTYRGSSASHRLRTAGAVIGATVVASVAVGVLIAQGSLRFWP